MKTTRFAQLARKAGRPKVHLAWSTPAHDPELRRALRQGRLLTVHQHFRGPQKDFAVVGLAAGPDVQFLIFPRPLRQYAGDRIVGIKYELFDEALSVGSRTKGGAQARRRATPEKSIRDGRSKKEVLNPGPKPGEPVSAAPPPAAEKKPAEEIDPTRRALLAAVADLRVGRPRRAQERLTALLRKL